MSLARGASATWIIRAVLSHIYDPRNARGEKTCLVSYETTKPPHYTFEFNGRRVTLDCFAASGASVIYVLKGAGWMLMLSPALEQITRATGDAAAMDLDLLAMRLSAPSV